MRTRVLVLLLAFTIFAVPVAAKKKYVGYRHRGVVVGAKLPNGVKDLGGLLLTNDNYGVTRYSKGRRHYLWLEKITSRNDKGVPEWLVTDVLSFKSLPANRQFVFSLNAVCKVNGEERPDMIVLARVTRRGKRIKPLKAWLADTDAERFKPISTRGVKCGANR